MKPNESIKAVLNTTQFKLDTGHNLSLYKKWGAFRLVTRIVWYLLLLASAAYLSILIYG